MAHSYVKEYLEKVTEQSQETAEQYRRIHLARIEKMITGVFPAAVGSSVFDIDRVLKLQLRPDGTAIWTL